MPFGSLSRATLDQARSLLGVSGFADFGFQASGCCRGARFMVPKPETLLTLNHKCWVESGVGFTGGSIGALRNTYTIFLVGFLL